MSYFGPVHFENLIQSSNGDIDNALGYVKEKTLAKK